jgi:transcriptional regulator with XRE-family HTH domain
VAINLKEIRLKKGLTQSQLAEAVGVSRVTITKVELGTRNFSIATLLKVSEFLGVSSDKLLKK